MQKSNVIDHPVLKEIEGRKSIRAFSDKPVEEEKLRSVFEAGRWSFSSSNGQAWRYIYAVKGQPLWDTLLGCLSEFNQYWCKHAPVLVISMAVKSTPKGTPYRHNLHDVGASSMLMAIQAQSMGLQLHPMAGFSDEKAREMLNIPEELETVTMMAIGYPGDDSHLSEQHKKAEHERSERFLQSEVVFNKPF